MNIIETKTQLYINCILSRDMPIYKYDPYTFEIECNDFESMSKDRARNLVYGGKLWTRKI